MRWALRRALTMTATLHYAYIGDDRLTPTELHGLDE